MKSKLDTFKKKRKKSTYLALDDLTNFDFESLKYKLC